MRPIAFSNPGSFFKGNLHTHSTRSDGVLDPGEVCRQYKVQGYDFIALTDHFVGRYNYPITDTTEFWGDGFVTLTGIEVHSGAMENGEIWHILAVGMPADFAPANAPDFVPRADQETGPEIALRCVHAGAFVAIAHPHWSCMTLADAQSISAAHAVEIYNHGCEVDSDRGYGFGIADLLVRPGCRLNFIATDDAHFKVADAFGGWVMVKAQSNTPENLLAALKAGSFYSSQGPEINDIDVDATHVHVRCSAVDRVIVVGQSSRSAACLGSEITTVSIPHGEVSEQSQWLRVSVVDAQGCHAWSNPIWWQE
jgi:histidinol phosphatase-like PHP family hydrolase